MKTTKHIKKEMLRVEFKEYGAKRPIEKGYLLIEKNKSMPYGLGDYSLYSKKAPQDVWDGQVFSSIRPFKGRWVAYISPDSIPSHLADMYIMAYEGPGEAYTVKLVKVLDDKDISLSENFIYWEQISGWPQRSKEGQPYKTKRVLRESSLIGEIVCSAYYTEAEFDWTRGELVLEVEVLFRKSLQVQSENLNLARLKITYNIDIEQQKFYGSPRGELQISYEPNPYSDWNIPSQKHLEDILEEVLIICPSRIDPALTLSHLFSFSKIEQNVFDLLIPYTAY